MFTKIKTSFFQNDLCIKIQVTDLSELVSVQMNLVISVVDPLCEWFCPSLDLSEQVNYSNEPAYFSELSRSN